MTADVSAAELTQTAASSQKESMVSLDSSRRVAGILLIGGAVITTVFNVIFPRADDPTDSAAVLNMMVESETVRQVSFLGVTIGLWFVAVGLVLVLRRVQGLLPESIWPMVARVGVLMGVAVFTASSGVGMAATHAATQWAATGSDLTSTHATVAMALNTVDDHVWALSLVGFWAAVAFTGVALLRAGYPRWQSWLAISLGGITALGVGIPMSITGPSMVLMLSFALLAQLTIIWAVILGIHEFRRSRQE